MQLIFQKEDYYALFSGNTDINIKSLLPRYLAKYCYISFNFLSAFLSMDISTTLSPLILCTQKLTRGVLIFCGQGFLFAAFIFIMHPKVLHLSCTQKCYTYYAPKSLLTFCGRGFLFAASRRENMGVNGPSSDFFPSTFSHISFLSHLKDTKIAIFRKVKKLANPVYLMVSNTWLKQS